MRLPAFLWIAWRYLFTRTRQTALTLSGVVLGVTIVTLMQSYIGGFLNYFIARALQATPYIIVTQTQPGLPNPAGPVQRALGSLGNPAIAVSQLPIPSEEEELENPRGATAAVAGVPGVVAVAPFVDGQGLAIYGGAREAVNFYGIDPPAEARATQFASNLLGTTPEELAQRPNGIILGKTLASDLGASVGNQVTILSQQEISARFQVIGLYSSRFEEVDANRAYINFSKAQQLLALRGASGLSVRTASPDTAGEVARRIEVQTGYRAQTWREINAGVLDLFTTISTIIYLVVALTMLVAGFGIANTLILTVNEKRRDIGVLKALGMPPTQIAALFLCTGLLVAVVGVAVGEVLGAAGIQLLAHTTIPIRTQPGGPITIEEQTFPMLQTPRVYLLSAVFGLLVSLFSSLLPAWRAAKADPVEAIRGAE